MGCLGIIAFILVWVVSWIIWGIVVDIVFFVAVGAPWALWEFLMYLTLYNIINAIAKLPSFIGGLLGFILTLPVAAVSAGICIWAYVQVFFMGIITFRGAEEDFVERCIVPLEDDGLPNSFVIFRFYYEHFQWLWGGGNFVSGYFPWQNGVWAEIGVMRVEWMMIKLFLLSLPYMGMFVLPLVPLLWSLTRPILGACAHLPSVSGNGNGRD